MKTIRDLQNLNKTGNKMPVLFIGHGSPMNGIENNQFTESWKKSVENVPKPNALLVVSAHWETLETKITAMPKPRTIHDFGGFPQALFEAKYDAVGNPELAKEIAENLKQQFIELDEMWGLDHGTWTILKHLYPNADIPVLQLSLNRLQTPNQHYELAKELTFLRNRGVLIIGSGNMVHNLRQINFAKDGGYNWADSANKTFKDLILSGAHDKLIKYESLGRDVALSVPTAEHYLPLLYVLGLKKGDEAIEIFNDSVDLGSISMTSVKIG